MKQSEDERRKRIRANNIGSILFFLLIISGIAWVSTASNSCTRTSKMEEIKYKARQEARNNILKEKKKAREKRRANALENHLSQ